MTEQELKELIKLVIDEMYLGEDADNTTNNVTGYNASWKQIRRVLNPDELYNDEED